MRHDLLLYAGLFIFVTSSPVTYAQEPARPESMTVEEIAARVSRTESAIVSRMRAFHPLVEVYIQNLATDARLGAVPINDEYFLGQFEWLEGKGPRLQALSAAKGALRQSGNVFRRSFGIQYLPDGFAAMSVPDWRLLDAARYEFTYVRREFLGEARCLVLDVRPKGRDSDGFVGRIWVEDRDYNIVRFNGINRNIDQTLSSFFRKKIAFHVDGWRVNVLPGFWMPAYVYCEESDLSGTLPRLPRLKSQIRFWGYAAKAVNLQQEFTAIQIAAPLVQDSAEPPPQLSPVLSQRRWEQEAEENVLDRLTKGGLLAPAGGIDKILETVTNNLEITNNLTVEPPVRCRILLTSPLESFTVGRTIVLSRGLIDVLPDEASLAMMLAHELAHVVLRHQLIDTKFAFADRLMIPEGDLLRTLHFRHTPQEELAADTKVIELLKNSPYKEKLGDAGLFLRAVAANAKQLPNLIRPHVGEHIADRSQATRLGELMEQAPALEPERLDQIAALPLGGRLVIDPWTGRADLIRNAAVPLFSAREKVPFAVTPLMPYIRYAELAPQTSSR